MREELENEVCSFSNLSVTSPTSQLILQHFRRFTYVTAHSPTRPLLHLCHSSFSNPSLASPTSQASRQCIHISINKLNKSMAIQPRRAKTDWSGCRQMAVQGVFWLAKRLSLNLNFSFLNRISLLLISSSYPIVLTRLGGPHSNFSVTSPTSQLILQPFRRFTYVIAHSQTLPLLHLRHSSFSNPSFASPTSQASRQCIHISINKLNKSVALQLRRAKTDWNGCCQMAVQGALWLA